MTLHGRIFDNVRIAFSTILITLVAADLLWWWRTRGRARQWRHSFRWQLFVGVFAGGQITLILWSFFVPMFVPPPWHRPPESLLAAAFLWHLLILLPTLILMAISVPFIWAWRRRRQPLRTGDVSRPAPTRRQFLSVV